MNSKKLDGVQALRFFAALLVVAFHISNNYSARHGIVPTGYIRSFGFAGVDIFFVLSGFIIWRTSANKAGPTATCRFLLRRYWRIYSAYIPAALFGGWVLSVVLPRHYLGIDWLRSLTLFPQSAQGMALDVSWTLTFEVYFYTLFAALIFFRRFALWMLAAFSIVIAFNAAASVGTGHRLLSAPVFFVALNPLIIEFLLGCVAAIVLRRTNAYANIAFPCGAALFLVSSLLYWQLGLPGGRLEGEVTRSVLFGFPSMLIVYGVVGLENRLSVPRPVVELGNASYALYLIHKPIVLLIFAAVPIWFPDADISVENSAIAAICIALIASLLYHRLIEIPLLALIDRRMRHGRTATRPPPSGIQPEDVSRFNARRTNAASRASASS